jgi:hypothetical protein
MLRTLATASLLALATTAQAQQAPTAGPLTAGWDLQAYSGAARIGSGNVNDDNTLFVVKEQRVGNEQSWIVFADPSSTVNLSATLFFGAPILNVITTSAALAASHATWGVDVDGDNRLNDYSSSAGGSMGLEATQDTLSWSVGQGSLTLNWRVANSGDAMRVVTAVPEPGTYALLALGLVAIGLQLSRRKTG